jgi:hypothetical protein
MRPDKLFDYLEDRLPDWERHEIETQLASDPHLQEQLQRAREIHRQGGGRSREVIMPEPDDSARGRKLALRVGSAFIVLIALNVGLGLFFIARREAGNPNRKLLENQMRDQLTKSLEQAAHAQLTPPPLDVMDVTIPVAAGRLNEVADQIVATAQRLGGTATRELPDQHRLGVLVDLPSHRENDFRAAIATLAGGAPPSPPSPSPAENTTDIKSFVVQIVEPGAP